MVLGRAYQVTDAALRELEQEGLREELLRPLSGLVKHKPFRRTAFLDVLSNLQPTQANPQEQEHILRTTRLSLLRLEKIIPSRGLREWADALIFALAIALVVRTFIIAPFKIPSGSMIPTIEIGDHIFATMFSYGLPVPFTDVKLLAQEIDRGDIVIFPFPGDPSVDYIKRVIGKSGETVRVEGTKVYVDGELLDEPYAYHDPTVLDSYKRNHLQLPDFGPVRVPEGHLFVMGDNRFHSSDSRAWGFVDQRTVRGRGQIVYWSHDPNAGLLGGYRLGRIASLVR